MSRLSLIRSLGEDLNCEITVVNMVKTLPKKNRPSSDLYSKYVTFHYDATKHQADDLCRMLLALRGNDALNPFLFSVDDDSAFLIDSCLDKLKGVYYCANIGNEQGAIGKWMDKQYQNEMASRYGFLVPRSWSLVFSDGKYVVPDDVVFPCYLKGQISFYSMKAYQGRFDSREDLEKALQELGKSLQCPMMVEEYLTLDRELGVMGVCDGRKCVVPGVVDLLKSGSGSHKGVSMYGRVRRDITEDSIVSRVSSFISSIGLFGLFNIDLAVADGKLYFIELNMRSAAYGYAIKNAGVNLPVLFVDACLSGHLSDDSFCLQRELEYVNDKVALDDWVNGFCSLAYYRDLKHKSDVSLLDVPNDPMPYTIFKRREIKNFIKAKIKRVLSIH